ncbi:galectin-9-like [Erpetoichthys calabaricus]|uniref:Galectin n=1 Tax=Erpetoichthys calabaricus TaxID=27687 RepID=A0A8C4S043_ERPCA|nr:galectin-9-like [Erpetoichthys calabaricus]
MAVYNQQPIFCPKIPFSGSIPGGLCEGKVITITGRVLPNADRFDINFKSGPDNALHFNPRYEGGDKYVVCNTCNNSSWGSEERTYKDFVQQGSLFTLTFLVNPDSYTVLWDGDNFLQYQHRIPICKVDTINVNGAVDVASISFQTPAPPMSNGQNFAAQMSIGQNFVTPMSVGQNFATPLSIGQNFAAPLGSSMTAPLFSAQPNYVVPYKAAIYGGMFPSKSIVIQGSIPHSAKRFHINLRSSSGIAMHLNPRLNESCVVRNSFLNGSWGSEERDLSWMPFKPGQNFTITIVSESHCLKVMVDGAHTFNYNHRVSQLHQIDCLEIDGDVNLSFVQC